MTKRLSQWLLIRSGEGRVVAYLSLIYLIVGLGMAIGRSSSDALLFKRVGVEFLPQMFFLTSILLALFSAMYAEFADRVAPARLFRHVSVVLTFVLLGVYQAMTSEQAHYAFAVYFLTYGVVSEILLVHISLYTTDFFNATQSKRLFPIVNAVSRLGGVLGGVGVGLASQHIALEHAALAWILTLGMLWWLLIFYHRKERVVNRPAPARKPRRLLSNIREGLQFARGSALLQIAGAGMFIMVVLISMQDYLVSTILTRHFEDERDLAAFFGWFFALTNLLVLLLQLLATNRLLRRFGLKTVSMIFPWSTALTFGWLAISPSFIPAMFARFNYTGMLPAFRNPAANLYYSALPGYMQGRARALGIGLVLPLGLAAAGLMLMLVPREAVGASLAVGGLLLSLLYLHLKKRKNKIYSDALIGLIRNQVFLSDAAGAKATGRLEPAVVAQIDRELARELPAEAFIALADLLIEGAPSGAGPILLKYLPSQPVGVQDQLLPRVAELAPTLAAQYIQQCLNGTDSHLKATALRALEFCDPEGAVDLAHHWLSESNPRLRSEAVRVVLHLTGAPLVEDAQQSLRDMLDATEPGPRIAALKVVGTLGLVEHAAAVHAALEQGDAAVRVAAVQAAAQLLEDGCMEAADWIDKANRDPDAAVRRAALQATARLPRTEARMEILAWALQDEDAGVRRIAWDCAGALMPHTLPEYQAAIARYARHFRMQALQARALARSGLEGARAELAGMVRHHLARAWEKKSVASGIANIQVEDEEEKKAAGFMGTILEEEVGRHLSLALEILGYLDASQIADTARAALASNDKRLCAQAVESIRNLDDPQMVTRLLPLLETRHDGAEWEHRIAHGPDTYVSLVAWCRAHGGVWLSRVAAALKGEQSFARPV